MKKESFWNIPTTLLNMDKKVEKLTSNFDAKLSETNNILKNNQKDDVNFYFIGGLIALFTGITGFYMYKHYQLLIKNEYKYIIDKDGELKE